MRIEDLFRIEKRGNKINIEPIDKNSPFVNNVGFLKKTKDDFLIGKTSFINNIKKRKTN